MSKIFVFLALLMLSSLLFSDAMHVNVHANPFEDMGPDVVKNQLLL